MRVAVILVHYHTPALAALAVSALRADAERSGIELEGIVVDNGSDAAGAALLERLPFTRLAPECNVGFAGGVNLGVARSTAGVVVVMNPDVEVLPGCLAALAGVLATASPIAGPRFYWDRDLRFALPPAEERSRFGELLGALATRGPQFARLARRRWRRHARRHWRASAPLSSHSLSGALLAFTREAWERIGPFDAEYQLYFEETDWLRRAQRRGVAATYVPAAEAIHFHGRSAGQESRAAQWFAESARRFRQRHFGRAFNSLLEWIARGAVGRSQAGAVPAAAPAGAPSGYHSPLWVEVSPNESGFPAAAEHLATPVDQWTFPAELAERQGLPLFALAVDEAGRELGRLPLDSRGR